MPDKYRHHRLKYLYGLEKGEFEDYFYLQGNQCAICFNDLDLTDNRRTHVDHCHETGEVRGILCQRCNVLLGLAEDNPFILLKSIAYLENPPVRQFKRYKKKSA